VERLGANASVQYAVQFWERLCVAARADGLEFDPVWGDQSDASVDADDGMCRETAAPNGTTSLGHTVSRSCKHTRELQLTESVFKDHRLYCRFRSNFGPYWNVGKISMAGVSTEQNAAEHVVSSTSRGGLNPLTGERWTSLLLTCEGVVADYNFMSLLRSDCLEPFWMTETVSCDGLLVVPRAQFICIELARTREGYYAASFRRMLETFDIKTACEELESAIRVLSCVGTDTSNDVHQNEQNSTAAAASAFRAALFNLSTQWPNPSKSTLKASGAISTLKRILKSTTSESWMHTESRALLQRWHDLVVLGNLVSQLVSSVNGDNKQEARGTHQSLQRAARALLKSSILPATGRASGSTTSLMSSNQPKYASRNTAVLDDLTIVDPSRGPTNGNIFAASGATEHMPMPLASKLFDEFGVVLFPSYCSTQEVTACRHQGDAALRRLQVEQLTSRRLMVDGDETFDFVEVRQRPGHRVDNRYTILDDPTSPIASLGQKLRTELPKLLFDGAIYNRQQWKLLYAGVVHAFPRRHPDDEPPPPQLWHRDGPSLFASELHHPTHCFNVFVPMVNISEENGATEFVPGTHEDARYDNVAADVVLGGRSHAEAATIRADCTSGSLIVFDVRVMHRGLSNQSSADRPMLYYTFCRDWFQEEHMFQKTESLLQGMTSKDAASISILCGELYLSISGTLPPESDSERTIGHPHYTARFDLLLLEYFETLSAADLSIPGGRYGDFVKLVNAILRFANVAVDVKARICREFIDALSSDQALERKQGVLAANRHERKKLTSTEGERDFSTIQEDMSDVTALYSLTAELLFDETSHLSKLGFAKNELCVCIALALLKCFAESSTSFPVTAAQLEECFNLWWNAGRGRSRFELTTSSRRDRTQKRLLVVFSSLGSGIARPEWFGTLRSIGVPSMDDLDVLHVMDFAFSWYCQDPLCAWNGTQYYESEIKKWTEGYQSVCMLGDSMGGSAALLFSALANTVLVFTPQVDISDYEAVKRSDFSLERRRQLESDIVQAVLASRAAISVHFGERCEEDVRQVRRLPKTDHLSLVGHDFDDHVLSLHLRDKGALVQIVERTLMRFIDS
jgi:Phytanoyl-CoA dioxygenase (PhyH)